MKVVLYTHDSPRGRCLILAQRLHQLTSLAATDCVQVAERLFANHHSRENPVTVDVSNSESVEELEATCAGLGIEVEGVQSRV